MEDIKLQLEVRFLAVEKGLVDIREEVADQKKTMEEMDDEFLTMQAQGRLSNLDLSLAKKQLA